jgi:hypothetical protein
MSGYQSATCWTESLVQGPDTSDGWGNHAKLGTQPRGTNATACRSTACLAGTSVLQLHWERGATAQQPDRFSHECESQRKAILR